MSWDWLLAAIGKSQSSAVAETRLGDVARLINGMPYDSKHFGPDGTRLVRIRDILGSRDQVHYNGPNLTPHRVTPGTLLVGMDGDFNVARWPGPDALLNQRVLAIATDQLSGKWIEYCLPSVLEITNDLTYATTVKHLSSAQVRAFRLPWPSAGQRQQILEYLDHETAEIDAFISELEQMREWLEERWRGALVELVQGRRLGGLVATDVCVWPTAPSSWLRTRLKATVASASNGSWGDEVGDSTGVRCIRVADFDKIRGAVHDMNPTSRRYDSPTLERLGLRHGDLLIEKSGGGPTSPVGNVVRYTGEGGEMYSNFVARIRVPPHVDSEYALRLHQSLYVGGVTARSVKQTTGIQNLDETAYFNEPVFLPDLERQKSIAALLSTQRTSTDEEIADIDAAIALAKERRAALITAAVTGQIDIAARQKPVVDSIQTAIEEAR